MNIKVLEPAFFHSVSKNIDKRSIVVSRAGGILNHTDQLCFAALRCRVS